MGRKQSALLLRVNSRAGREPQGAVKGGFDRPHPLLYLHFQLPSFHVRSGLDSGIYLQEVSFVSESQRVFTAA